MNTLIKPRIESIDLLKGIVMVLMALDHTRDYFYQTGAFYDITNPATASVPLYVTRWITHFCAPVFSFLAGISAYMSGRKKTKADLSVFLIKRGLWLIVMELTIISFAWYLDVQFSNFDLAVIWVLGASMIFLAGFVHLPNFLILVISCILIFGHNLLDQIHFERSILWSLVHETGSFKIAGGRTLNLVYPIIPWAGVMALGYYFGQFYDISIISEKRKGLFNLIGIACILLFLLIRFTNLYGDPASWKYYETTSQTVMSFMNVNKYPPSLLYLLATLSGAFIFLANSEKWRAKLVDFFCVFGRVPFFYYILHLYFIRILAMIVAELTGFGWDIMVQTSFDIDLHGFGFSLPVVYLIWISIILILYPICKKFDAYKRSHKENWWLSYL
ncbi:DUF1624 domain-containing protein [Dyadobacter psychrotolerans]|uniref:DUF1624 domain-containing protein n=1 Tax=Dyadobacter psychrotolerans TaxID=2541721 RepID=A0A4R5E232_9BACT|nr:heparan-alpha-glucosaminide N-acetyltransferase domain-containing protein [Dyadobacter psychrotolerans]TDE18285.1 DUF1624 domain-containing protein [Dyadobacter psychrotolerans]